MKKFSWLEIIVIAIGILASCFSISVIAHCKFGLDTDFLSSAATIFAAFIAMLLFNDWREQHKVLSLERLQGKLSLSAEKIFENFVSVLDSGYSKDVPVNTLEDEEVQNYKLQNPLRNLEKELVKADVSINEYISFLSNFDEGVKNHVDEMIEHRESLSGLNAFLHALAEYENREEIKREIRSAYELKGIMVPVIRYHEICTYQMQIFNQRVLKGEIKGR